VLSCRTRTVDLVGLTAAFVPDQPLAGIQVCCVSTKARSRQEIVDLDEGQGAVVEFELVDTFRGHALLGRALGVRR